jgi:protocatechuate 3,4-dioxygenase beta subunit
MEEHVMRASLIFLVFAFATSAFAAQREPIVGLPCEGCEAVFEGLPNNIASRTRIAPRNEPGQTMIVSGRVFDAQGKPRAGIIVYAYQTNDQGIYPTSERNLGLASHRHGLLRSWARSNTQGYYAFDTIRPAGYPNTDLPAHIHMHVIEPGCATYYIDDIMFKDDPRLTAKQVEHLTLGRAGTGIGMPIRGKGIWYITRDIYLGLNVPGYPACPP